MAEVELSQNDIDLGAIASLSHLENPTLIDMKMAYGNTLAITWVKQHISLLNAASGASNRMDDLALNLCSLDIITSFPFLTLGEFCVFCARMRSLRYVQRRSDYVFSSDTIMQGIREFIRDRHEELVRYEREEKMRREREDVAMSHEQAVTTPEYLEQMKRERCAVRPATDVEEKVREFAREFRPQVMSEEEFQQRRDEQLRRMKEKYNV